MVVGTRCDIILAGWGSLGVIGARCGWLRLIITQKIIANKLKNYFVDVVPNLVSNIPTSSKHFETYLSHNESSLERDLIDEQLTTAYFSIITNKSPVYDEINYKQEAEAEKLDM